MHRITIVGIAALAVAGCSSTPTPAAQAPMPVKTVTVTASPVNSTGPASAVVPSPAGNAGSATPKATKALDPRTVVKTKRPTVQVVCGPENDQIRTPEVRGITYDQQMEWSGSEAMVTARAKSGHRIADGYKTRWTFTDKATPCSMATPRGSQLPAVGEPTCRLGDNPRRKQDCLRRFGYFGEESWQQATNGGASAPKGDCDPTWTSGECQSFFAGLMTRDEINRLRAAP
ncbi:hypothetical protein [Arsenicicoccus bolidensis]|uniref:Uncharacterized protein n=1 Tax=Arsenicicoccus bolidensis TaxID=229480 RepID=A0ABS9PZV5_9MICO|nr:hypothetical protein [Arsenicicoccus bolidensis]MCG7321142.1 hypothetical protein [Arsenicicoccus bolidensis]